MAKASRVCADKEAIQRRLIDALTAYGEIRGRGIHVVFDQRYRAGIRTAAVFLIRRAERIFGAFDGVMAEDGAVCQRWDEAH